MAENPTTPFPLVALCASAGGLYPLEAIVDALPPSTGMAFVVVQHLLPESDSVLTRLLQRHTALPVKSIEDDMRVEPDTIYVLQPGYEVTIWNGHLRLNPIGKQIGHPNTINRFLESLARGHGPAAAAVILSGAGMDGTEGSRAIKANGGLVIAQDSSTAGYTSMPEHVVNAGLSDAVLDPVRIPLYLREHFGEEGHKSGQVEGVLDHLTQADLQRVVQRLRELTGHNFTDYKTTTLRRQIASRMAAYRLTSVDDYLLHLEERPQLAEQLVQFLLIHVTRFFRDPEAFETLKQEALLPLLRTLDDDTIFRAWVPGCASGEEAVSIAILLYECLQELDKHRLIVRLFASDANASMIQRARRGLYPPSIEEDISPERLEAHFSQEAEGYRVRDHIGRMIVWSVHDLVENPPFSNLHLMSCRNVLIYFQRRLQERVFALMQYAVERDGILFLGSAESLPDYVDTFTAVDSRHRIYRQTGDGRQSWTRLDQPLFTQLPDRSPRGHADRAPAEADLAPQDALIKQGLAAHFNTSGALVDQAMQVRYTYGQIYHYLRVLPGPNRQHSILDMVVDGLKDELATVLYQAFETDSPVTRHGLRFESNGREHHIDLSVRLAAHEDGARLGVVMFRQVPEPAPDRATQGDGAAEIARLEAELDDTRTALHTLTRALKAKDEDFITSMEEIRAASEEFRISQEEAETTREELESLNEELNTLNNQLIAQNDELTEANNTLHNFLQSTEIAMVFLNQALAVREYTRRAADIFSLRPADVGRPLGDIANRLVDDDLEQDAYTVLNNLGQVEKEIQTRDDRWYILRIRPSRTVQNAVDGLVLTFSDITAQKDTQAALQETESQQRALAEAVEAERSRLATVLANLPVGVWITDRDGRVLETNPQARQIWAGETPLSESVEAYREYRSWWLDTGREILPEEQPLAQVLKTGEPVLGVEMRIQRFDGTTGVILASAAPIIDPLQDFIGAVGIAQDITERQRTRDAMRENERQRERLTIVETEQRRLQAVLEDLPLAVWITDDDGRITHATRQSDVIWGSMAPHAETVEADRIYPLYWPDTGEEVTPEEHPLVRALATGERVPWTRLHVRRPDGDTRIVLFSATAVQDGDGLAGAVGVGQDITDIHHVLERVDYQRQLINLIENGLLVLDGDLRVLTANAAFYETFQVSEEETVGTLLTDLGNGQWDIPELHRLLTEVLAEREIVRSYRVTHEFPGLGQRTMLLNARQIAELDRVLLVITDISK